MELTETTLTAQFYWGAASGIVLGSVLGFLIGLKVKQPKQLKSLTSLQLLSVVMFFMYLILSFAVERQPSEFIAAMILAMTGGEAVGSAIEKGLDNRK